MLDAGRARSLAIMAAERNPQFPNVPTLKEALGIDYRTGAWRGIAGPLNLPAEIARTLTASLEKVNRSGEFREFMANRGFGVLWADAAGFAAFMERADQSLGEAMRAAGLARA